MTDRSETFLEDENDNFHIIENPITSVNTKDIEIEDHERTKKPIRILFYIITYLLALPPIGVLGLHWLWICRGLFHSKLKYYPWIIFNSLSSVMIGFCMIMFWITRIFVADGVIPFNNSDKCLTHPMPNPICFFDQSVAYRSVYSVHVAFLMISFLFWIKDFLILWIFDILILPKKRKKEFFCI